MLVQRAAILLVFSVICMGAYRPPDEYNVRILGAAGNGADATAAFRAASAAIVASGKGGAIFVPKGDYKISGVVILPSNTRLYGEGGGSKITGAAAAWDGNGFTGLGTSPAFTCAPNASNIEIEGLNFAYPVNSGSRHVIEFLGCSAIHVKDNVSDGGANFTAFIGTSGVLEEGNRVTNITNSCYDHWQGATNIQVIGNFCSTYSGAVGVGAINFTGINTDLTAANTVGFVATDNVILQNSGGQCIDVNSHSSGGSDRSIRIAHNHCIAAAGINTWGFLLLGTVKYAVVEGNICEGDGATFQFACVGAQAPAIGVSILDNVAANWGNGSTILFSTASAGGLIRGNRAYGSAGQTVDTTGATGVAAYDNDKSTGTISFGNPTAFTLGTTGHVLTDLTVDGIVTSATSIHSAGGSAATPGYGFFATPGVGMMLDSSRVAWATNSTERALIDTAGNFAMVGGASGGAMVPSQMVVSQLPACGGGNKGYVYEVLDANAPTYGATLSGGGAVAAFAVCDGVSAWKAH